MTRTSPVTALVTGVSGQDGVFLARHLLAEGHTVVGTVQPGSTTPMRTYLEGVVVEELDVRDTAGFVALLDRHRPDEVYNLAGFTAVGASWDQPDLVDAVNRVAVEGMLAALAAGSDPPRFFQASSAEVFGPAGGVRDETGALDPRNPYAESKARAQEATEQARADGLFASVGILFNHEGPLRGTKFVSGKITRAAAEIAAGVRDRVSLGNLDVARDWGSARDYVRAIHLSLQQDAPDDFVVATGRLRTLSDLLETAFASVGIDDPWPYVEQDPALLRPNDNPGLAGDATKAREVLGWTPTTTFEETISEMVRVDTARIRTGVEQAESYLTAPSYRP